MPRILSKDNSSKYSLSHSSKSVLTVSGLQFTTTVFLPSWRSVRILETAHQSNSTLLPAETMKLGKEVRGEAYSYNAKRSKVYCQSVQAKEANVLSIQFLKLRNINFRCIMCTIFIGTKQGLSKQQYVSFFNMLSSLTANICIWSIQILKVNGR